MMGYEIAKPQVAATSGVTRAYLHKQPIYRGVYYSRAVSSSFNQVSVVNQTNHYHEHLQHCKYQNESVRLAEVQHYRKKVKA